MWKATRPHVYWEYFGPNLPFSEANDATTLTLPGHRTNRSPSPPAPPSKMHYCRQRLQDFRGHGTLGRRNTNRDGSIYAQLKRHQRAIQILSQHFGMWLGLCHPRAP